MGGASISVVISTRNRAERLPELFPYLAALRHPSWELIFVDNNSTDQTWDVIGEFIAAAAIDARRLREPGRGASIARNAGVRASSGAIVAFTDDDCYPAPDWLIRLEAAFEDPHVGFVGGRVLLHDPSDEPITIQLRDREKRFRRRGYISPGEIHGANMAFRRDVLIASGGFDTKLGAGQPLVAEDIDLLNRVAAAGWDGLYAPDVVVSHHHRRKSADAGKLRVDYAKGRGALLVKVLRAGSMRQKLAALKAAAGSVVRRPGLAWWELTGFLAYVRLARQRS